MEHSVNHKALDEAFLRLSRTNQVFTRCSEIVLLIFTNSALFEDLHSILMRLLTQISQSTIDIRVA